MKCIGCNENKKLIDAHIIPKSFFMELKGEENHLDVVDSTRNGRLGRTFKGDYDKKILCKTCDSKFEKYDDYAKKLLVGKRNEFIEIYLNNKHVGWEVEYDHYKLRQFLLSVLWRASISKRPFFSKINLGLHEDVIKREVFSARKVHSADYQFLLSLFTPDKIPSLERTILCPFTTQMQGVVFCKIIFLGYIAWVKIDQKPIPEMVQSYVAKDGERLKIIASSFEGSNERQIIHETHSTIKT